MGKTLYISSETSGKERTPKHQEKPSGIQRIKFTLFHFLWAHLAILDPDPDPYPRDYKIRIGNTGCLASSCTQYAVTPTLCMI
jgi:hypothetical protein